MESKLLAIQAELKAPKNQKNTFGNYKYRSQEDILEAVKPLLKKHGLVLTIADEIVNLGNRFYVKATAMLSEAGNALACVSAYAREEETKKGMDAAQITGSASSYARKYALNGLFLIDDTKDSDATNTHGRDEKPTTARPEATEGTPEIIESVGKIDKRGAKNKGGFIPYTLLGVRMEDGTDIKFTTKDQGMVDLMDEFKESKDTIRIKAQKTAFKGYADILSVSIESEDVPF
jgi:hypothetical protein